MNNYDFPVKMSTLQTAGGIIIPKRLAVTREDGTPIGIVSDRYGLLPHKEVVEGFREVLDGKKMTEKITMTKGGARMYYDITLPDVKFNVAKGDAIALRIIAENSYDASQSLQVTFGAFRFVCSNGMIIGRRFASIAWRHMGTMVGSDGLLDLLQKQVGMMTTQFERSAPVMKQMTETKLIPSPIEFFDPKALRVPTYIAKTALEDYEKKGETVWDAYNALTASITHNMKKDSPRFALNYGESVWDASVALIK